MFLSIISANNLNAMVQLALKVPEGDFVEVGVYQGGSAWKLYEVAIAQGRRLHLFDSFCGTPVFTEGLDHHTLGHEEFYAPDGTIERIEKEMPLAHIYPGTFPYTMPEAGLGNLAFVHVDCDQYESYKACIAHLWPQVVVGGIMLFDDYPYLAGAKKAVDEAFAPHELKLAEARYYVVKQ